MPTPTTPTTYSRTLAITALLSLAGIPTASTAADDIFGTPRFYGGAGTFATAAGDFDNDGDIDFVGAESPRIDGFGQITSHGSLAVYLNDGNSGFFPFTTFDTDHGGQAIAAADLNNDGNLDFVAANILDHVGNITNVVLGNGDGTFQPAVSYGTSATNSRALALADMDNDGDIDIVLANGDRVLLNDGSGNFATNFVGSDVLAGGSIAVGDVNADGVMDILTARDFAFNSHLDYVSLQLGTGNGQGDPGAPIQIPIGGLSPNRVALGDMNNDGNLDAVALNQETFTIAVVPGNGDGTFATPITMPVNNSGNIDPQVMTIADLDGDGILDAAVTVKVFGNASSHLETSIMLGDGTGSLVIAQVIERFGRDNENIVAVDFDADADIDLANATHLLDNLSCRADFNDDGMVNTQDFLAFLNAWSSGEAVADFNGDGRINTLDVIAFLGVWTTGCS